MNKSLANPIQLLADGLRNARAATIFTVAGMSAASTTTSGFSTERRKLPASNR